METDPPVVRRLTTLTPTELAPLQAEAREQGFRFLDTLADEFFSGANRFDKPGEALFGVYKGAQLVAVGGLNRDPFVTDKVVGRVRRVYVTAASRRSGVGRMLLEAIIEEAKRHYPLLTLRTDSDEGAAFYEALQFSPVDADAATHHLPLAQ